MPAAFAVFTKDAEMVSAHGFFHGYTGESTYCVQLYYVALLRTAYGVSLPTAYCVALLPAAYGVSLPTAYCVPYCDVVLPAAL